MKKSTKYIIIGAITVFIGLYLSPYLVFMNSEIICAKVKQEGAVKGMKGLVYYYKYKGKVYRGNFDSSSGISMRLDVYKDKECLEVEVSKLIPSISRVKVIQSKKNN